ncbi:Uncharacterised protein [Shigella sonnei]|nr:Uncharacterised protein [Shigella sonnei]
MLSLFLSLICAQRLENRGQKTCVFDARLRLYSRIKIKSGAAGLCRFHAVICA